MDSIVVDTDEKCYLQIFLEICKYAVKKKTIINTINEELKLDESDDDEFDKSDEDQNYANGDKNIYE